MGRGPGAPGRERRDRADRAGRRHRRRRPAAFARVPTPGAVLAVGVRHARGAGGACAPADLTVRLFRPGDERAAHRLIEDAFAAWQPRRKSYAEWARHTVERPAFAPGLSSLAFVDGQLVGAVMSLDLPETGEGYVEQVAVRPDHRNRGIARLLLRHAFRAFHRHGRRRCTLWTHSNTGALELYLRVGMTVARSSTVFRKGLADDGPGAGPPA
ncbi:GNAT family N-acetyltransferase [Streptomyces albulus]|nr:GNAT family N-acetyltransferase [Streptomyces noursei]